MVCLIVEPLFSAGSTTIIFLDGDVVMLEKRMMEMASIVDGGVL